MTVKTETFQGHMQQQEPWHETLTRSNDMQRFRDFIEESDWDDVILAQEEWINRMCIGVMIVAALYFTPPVLMMLFLG
jgi:hypothetical protein